MLVRNAIVEGIQSLVGGVKILTYDTRENNLRRTFKFTKRSKELATLPDP